MGAVARRRYALLASVAVAFDVDGAPSLFPVDFEESLLDSELLELDESDEPLPLSPVFSLTAVLDDPRLSVL
jgi:hypothetical protein